MRYSKKSAITWGLTALLCLQLSAVSAAAQPVENSGAPAAASAPPAAPPPTYAAGGDVIVATIGAGAKDVAVGKNNTQ